MCSPVEPSLRSHPAPHSNVTGSHGWQYGGGLFIGGLFIGGAGRAEELKEAAAQNPGVGRYLPFQPAEALPYSMTSGDIAVVTLGKGTEGISMPSKCYYMMAAGCAILGLSEGVLNTKTGRV